MAKSNINLGLKLGLLIVLPLVGFLLLGVWLDSLMKTSPWCMLAGVLIGIIVAIILVCKVIIPYLDKKD